MKNTYPKKFALIGLPGSGKSMFASKLGETLGIPVHHLDICSSLAERKRARIEELREKYPQTNFIIFQDPKDADLFLSQKFHRRSCQEKEGIC